MKKKILILVGICLLLAGTSLAQEIDNIKYETEKAEVVKVGEALEVEDSFEEYHQEIQVRILTGRKKGELATVTNILGDNLAYNIVVEPGDKVALTIETDLALDSEQMVITDYYRIGNIKLLILLFILLVILIGGRQGARALVSLGLTIGAIVYILLPGILKGQNPILLSTLVSIGVTIITILLITGASRKSLAAIVGTSLGVIFAALLAFFIGKTTKLTGLSADDVTMLMYIPQKVSFNFQHLLFAGIILGTLGAVMDVGMSIASAIDEIYQANPSLGAGELFSSGMNVGRDIMGTMINTLILAYTGASIPILLLFMAYDSTILDVINLDMIATEIVRSVSGSIGLILTIPITSLVASLLLDGASRKIESEEEKGD